MNKTWKYGMLAISIFGVFWLVDRSNGIYWVGNTNLEVVLCIKDRESGTPIPDAMIAVITDAEDGLPQGAVNNPTDHMYHFSMKTGASGIARLGCQDERLDSNHDRSMIEITLKAVSNP